MENVKQIYTIEDCESLTNEDLKDKVLVTKIEFLRDEYKQGKYQLWKANGGFGCRPETIGRAVFCTSLYDGEEARFERGDFIGILKEDLIKELKVAD